MKENIYLKDITADVLREKVKKFNYERYESKLNQLLIKLVKEAEKGNYFECCNIEDIEEYDIDVLDYIKNELRNRGFVVEVEGSEFTIYWKPL